MYMKVLIPAAGYGTRILSFFGDIPKTFITFKDKPILEYILLKVMDLPEIDEVVIITNAKFYDFFLKWKNQAKFPFKITLINDGTSHSDERLGTIGDIQFAIEKLNIKEDILVINSDNLFSFNIGLMKKNFEEKKSPVISLYDVKEVSIAKLMGNVSLNDNNKIVYFKEKDPNTTSTLCSVGIYIFPKEVVGLFGEYLKNGNSADRSGDFVEWLYKKTDVYGFVFDSEKDYWFDIGSKELYDLAKNYLFNKI